MSGRIPMPPYPFLPVGEDLIEDPAWSTAKERVAWVIWSRLTRSPGRKTKLTDAQIAARFPGLLSSATVRPARVWLVKKGLFAATRTPQGYEFSFPSDRYSNHDGSAGSTPVAGDASAADRGPDPDRTSSTRSRSRSRSEGAPRARSAARSLNQPGLFDHLVNRGDPVEGARRDVDLAILAEALGGAIEGERDG